MDTNNGSKILSILLIVFALLLVGFVAYSLLEAEDDVVDDDTPAAVEEQPQPTVEPTPETNLVTIEEILGNPAPFVGETVTIDAIVQDLISEQAFTISDAVQGDELLVVAPAPLSADLQAQANQLLGEENAKVRVTGEVTQLSVQEVMQRFNAGIPQEVAEAYGNGPILILDSATAGADGTSFDFPDQAEGAETPATPGT